MQIQNSMTMNRQISPKINRQQQFTGVLDASVAFLRFLDTNQAWGATAVDLGCMVFPRTITDFTRNAKAGMETARREGSGTANHAAIGLVYGPLAGMIMGQAIANKYQGVKANKIYADADTVDILGKFHYDIIKHNNAQNAEAFAEDVANNITTSSNKGLSEEGKNAFKKHLTSIIEKNETPSKDDVKVLKSILLSDLGEESDIILKNGTKTIKTKLDDLAGNISNFSHALFRDKVVDAFKNAKQFSDVSFIKSMKGFVRNRALLGLGIASAVGASVQPMNIYLTKKKTGTDGFVGVEGRQKDNSVGFKILKGLTAAAFATFAILTIGNPKNLLKNIQYKGITPTIEQFKLVYGLTIASRFLVARDKDELREGAIKDVIGFSTWLLLGNFVAKGTLKLIDKIRGSKLFGRTRDELLYESLKKQGLTDKIIQNGKVNKFGKLLPLVDKATRKNMRFLSVAQLAGYAFSAAVLGVGIPKLNIHMTNKREARNKAKTANTNPIENMLKPENMAFLSSNMNFGQKFNN